MSMELGRMFRRIQHIFRPARTSAPPRENDVIQHLQVEFNEFEMRELPSMQHYGFGSSPLTDCDVIVAAVSGDGSNSIVVGSNDQRYRPKGMSPGEVRIYNNAGTYIQVKGGEVNIIAASKVNFTTPEVTMSGKLTVAQDIITTGGDVKAQDITLKTHRHTGVQLGGGITGTPTA